jgi:hypothetical protein
MVRNCVVEVFFFKSKCLGAIISSSSETYADVMVVRNWSNLKRKVL